MTQKLEPGRYIVTDISSGKVLDLSLDNTRLQAFNFHGGDGQQWEFCPCGTGFIINSIRANDFKLFVAVQDLNSLHLEGSTKVVPRSLPMCWNVELLPVGPADTELEDVLARIRLPYTDKIQLTLGFKGSELRAPLFLGKDVCTFWRLRPVGNRHEQVVKNTPITTNEPIVEGPGAGVKKTVITTTSVTTTTRTVTRVVPGDV